MSQPQHTTTNEQPALPLEQQRPYRKFNFFHKLRVFPPKILGVDEYDNSSQSFDMGTQYHRNVFRANSVNTHASAKQSSFTRSRSRSRRHLSEGRVHSAHDDLQMTLQRYRSKRKGTMRGLNERPGEAQTSEWKPRNASYAGPMAHGAIDESHGKRRHASRYLTDIDSDSKRAPGAETAADIRALRRLCEKRRLVTVATSQGNRIGVRKERGVVEIVGSCSSFGRSEEVGLSANVSQRSERDKATMVFHLPSSYPVSVVYTPHPARAERGMERDGRQHCRSDGRSWQFDKRDMEDMVAAILPIVQRAQGAHRHSAGGKVVSDADRRGGGGGGSGRDGQRVRTAARPLSAQTLMDRLELARQFDKAGKYVDGTFADVEEERYDGPTRKLLGAQETCQQEERNNEIVTVDNFDQLLLQQQSKANELHNL